MKGPDVRQPAASGDFETSMQRTPKPPLQVYSKVYFSGAGTGAGMRYLEIVDDQTLGRETGVSYRIYYLPARTSEITGALVGTPGFLLGAARAALPVGSVEASSSSTTRFQIVDGPNIPWGEEGSGGWWFVRAVNRFGQMSEPSMPIPDQKLVIP